MAVDGNGGEVNQFCMAAGLFEDAEEIQGSVPVCPEGGVRVMIRPGRNDRRQMNQVIGAFAQFPAVFRITDVAEEDFRLPAAAAPELSRGAPSPFGIVALQAQEKRFVPQQVFDDFLREIASGSGHADCDHGYAPPSMLLYYSSKLPPVPMQEAGSVTKRWKKQEQYAIIKCQIPPETIRRRKTKQR